MAEETLILTKMSAAEILAYVEEVRSKRERAAEERVINRVKSQTEIKERAEKAKVAREKKKSLQSELDNLEDD